MGTSNARIILGQAIVGPADANGLISKLGTKVQDCTLTGLSIQPASNHAGECVLLDYADNTLIELCTIGPFGNDGSTVTIGVKTNWVQWVYIDKNQINVNGAHLAPAPDHPDRERRPFSHHPQPALQRQGSARQRLYPCQCGDRGRSCLRLCHLGVRAARQPYRQVHERLQRRDDHDRRTAPGRHRYERRFPRVSQRHDPRQFLRICQLSDRFQTRPVRRL
jgi:hypothetical protein